MKTVHRNIKHVSSLQPKKVEEKDVANGKYKITFINII